MLSTGSDACCTSQLQGAETLPWNSSWQYLIAKVLLAALKQSCLLLHLFIIVAVARSYGAFCLAV